MLTIKNNIVYNQKDNDELQELVKIIEQEPNFLDHQFPSNVQSLIFGCDPTTYSGEWNTIKWKRLPNINLGKMTLDKEIDPMKLRFGRVEIRNILNVLSVLACRRDLIDRIIEIKDIKSNVFAVWIFMDGKWQMYVVDSLFPSYGTNVTSKFIFSYTENNDVWVNIIEKAYAKALHSYYKLFIPNAVFTLQHLTGLPIEKVPMYDLKELWAKLKENLKKSNFIVSEFIHEDGFERLFVVVNFYEHPTCKLLKIKNGYKLYNKTA